MKTSISAAFVAVCLAQHTLQAATATFTPMGDLTGSDFLSLARGVSGDGQVVVGLSVSAGGSEAFRWTQAGGIKPLGVLPGGTFSTDAHATSADGSVVVGSGALQAPEGRAFRWTAATSMVSLNTLPGGTFDDSAAFDVSPDGAVVVGISTVANGSEAFRWTQAGGMVGLGHLGQPAGGPFSTALGMSADGNVVVGQGQTDAGAGFPFRWTQATDMVQLGSDPGTAFDTSAGGSIVVGHIGGSEAFRWTSGSGVVPLGDLPGARLRSTALAISDDGRVIVGKGETDAGDEAFVWDKFNGMRSLQELLTQVHGIDLTGWQLSEATDVSSNGTVIVGFGVNPSGADEGWRVRVPPIPEPATVAMMGLGGLAMLRRRR